MLVITVCLCVLLLINYGIIVTRLLLCYRRMTEMASNLTYILLLIYIIIHVLGCIFFSYFNFFKHTYNYFSDFNKTDTMMQCNNTVLVHKLQTLSVIGMM